MRLKYAILTTAILGVGVALGAWINADEIQTKRVTNSVNEVMGASEALAQTSEQTLSPVKALAEREVYYPGTEDIKPDEMRVTACGTGMPNARPKQAAACFLVELGNGDKFIFDIGTGSAERLSGLAIPYDYLDKVFIGHLHADH
ncbi:MAG: hypothetical protein ACR2O0_12830, partial [Rhizobiaceae bacterium]